LAATSQACGTPRSGVSDAGTGTARAAGSELLVGRDEAARLTAPRALAKLGAHRRHDVVGQRAAERVAGQLLPRPSKTSAVPATRPAMAWAIASRPRSESTIRCRRSWAAMDRCSSAYCSLTSRENAFSVTAMNGTS
jgi:hypothetical protein